MSTQTSRKNIKTDSHLMEAKYSFDKNKKQNSLSLLIRREREVKPIYIYKISLWVTPLFSTKGLGSLFTFQSRHHSPKLLPEKKRMGKWIVLLLLLLVPLNHLVNDNLAILPSKKLGWSTTSGWFSTCAKESPAMLSLTELAGAFLLG